MNRREYCAKSLGGVPIVVEKQKRRILSVSQNNNWLLAKSQTEEEYAYGEKYRIC